VSALLRIVSWQSTLGFGRALVVWVLERDYAGDAAEGGYECGEMHRGQPCDSQTLEERREEERRAMDMRDLPTFFYRLTINAPTCPARFSHAASALVMIQQGPCLSNGWPVPCVHHCTVREWRRCAQLGYACDVDSIELA